MIHVVGQNDAIRQLAAQGGQSRIVGHVARGKDKSGLLGVEFSNGRLQGYGMLVVSGDVPSSTGTGAIRIKSLMHGLDHLGIAAHTKVVIGAPHSHTLVGVLGVGFGEFLGQTVDVVEVAVRLVLVLLVELGLVEALVVKFGSDGGGGLSSADNGGDLALVVGVLGWAKGWGSCSCSISILVFQFSQLSMYAPASARSVLTSAAWASLGAALWNLARSTFPW
jgi:hypothetical protein